MGRCGGLIEIEKEKPAKVFSRTHPFPCDQREEFAAFHPFATRILMEVRHGSRK